MKLLNTMASSWTNIFQVSIISIVAVLLMCSHLSIGYVLPTTQTNEWEKPSAQTQTIPVHNRWKGCPNDCHNDTTVYCEVFDGDSLCLSCTTFCLESSLSYDIQECARICGAFLLSLITTTTAVATTRPGLSSRQPGSSGVPSTTYTEANEKTEANLAADGLMFGITFVLIFVCVLILGCVIYKTHQHRKQLQNVQERVAVRRDEDEKVTCTAEVNTESHSSEPELV